jgi:hypothetical protein
MAASAKKAARRNLNQVMSDIVTQRFEEWNRQPNLADGGLHQKAIVPFLARFSFLLQQRSGELW